MTTVKVKFDGRVFVPEGPVDLPVGYELEMPIAEAPGANGLNGEKTALQELVDMVRQFPPTNLPRDLAAQHDHYLYGLPKRE